MSDTFSADLRTFLLADGDISTPVGTRVHPLSLPQNCTLPALTFDRMATERGATHDGPERIAVVGLRVSCWAETLLAARSLAEAVRKRLNGYVGTMGAATVVQATFMDGDSDDYQADPEQFVSDLDFEIWVEETV